MLIKYFLKIPSNGQTITSMKCAVDSRVLMDVAVSELKAGKHSNALQLVMLSELPFDGIVG